MRKFTRGLELWCGRRELDRHPLLPTLPVNPSSSTENVKGEEHDKGVKDLDLRLPFFYNGKFKYLYFVLYLYISLV